MLKFDTIVTMRPTVHYLKTEPNQTEPNRTEPKNGKEKIKKKYILYFYFMASTRNRNTPGNYCLEQRQYAGAEQYMLYANSQHGTAYNTQLPGNGLLPAQIPWNKLSYNAADTESFLFGIGSTNLVNPAPPFKPEIASLSSANIYEKKPIFIPEPFVQEMNQRPFPAP